MLIDRQGGTAGPLAGGAAGPYDGSCFNFSSAPRVVPPQPVFPSPPMLFPMPDSRWHSTTILTVRSGGVVAVGGDGQVTFNNTVMKADSRKVRRLLDGSVIAGFAGSAADAFALLERFEAKAKNHPGNLVRAATELAREWRTDRALRRLEAMLVAVNAETSLLVGGSGDVIQPADGVIGIGSGGAYAAAAAKALLRNTSLSAGEVVRQALGIAAEIDIYTNDNLIVEELPCR